MRRQHAVRGAFNRQSRLGGHQSTQARASSTLVYSARVDLLQPTFDTSPGSEALLAEGLARVGIEDLPSYSPGSYHIPCPCCGGGSGNSANDLGSCTVVIHPDSDMAVCCHRADCDRGDGLPLSGYVQVLQLGGGGVRSRGRVGAAHQAEERDGEGGVAEGVRDRGDPVQEGREAGLKGDDVQGAEEGDTLQDQCVEARDDEVLRVWAAATQMDQLGYLLEGAASAGHGSAATSQEHFDKLTDTVELCNVLAKATKWRGVEAKDVMGLCNGLSLYARKKNPYGVNEDEVVKAVRSLLLEAPVHCWTPAALEVLRGTFDSQAGWRTFMKAVHQKLANDLAARMQRQGAK